MPDMALSDPSRGVVMVTGAASGIGRATAVRLAESGARGLVLLDRDDEALHALGAVLERPGLELLLCRQDVADEVAWEGVEHGVRHHWNGLDGVVACAGVSNAGAIADLSLEAWRRVLGVNLDGAFLTL